jgi:hypothetical protein
LLQAQSAYRCGGIEEEEISEEIKYARVLGEKEK